MFVLRLLAWGAAWALVVGCGGEDIEAVGSPGGVFRPGAGCSPQDLEGGGPQACAAAAQLSFDGPDDDRVIDIRRPALLSARQVSCRRSYCGSGALSLHAEYRRPVFDTPDSDWLGEIGYRLPQPVDLYGKTLTHALFIEGPMTPVNAYVAVLDEKGIFHMVEDGPVFLLGQWIQRGGALSADNPKLKLAPGQTSLLVSEIIISVYLAREVLTGDRQRWSGDFHIDEIGWR